MTADQESSDLGLAAQTVAVRVLFRAAACSIALVDETGANLVYRAAAGEGSREILHVVLPVGRGIAGWTALAGQPIALGNVRSDPRFARDIAEQTHYVPTTIMAAPMFQPDGEVLGVLSVLDPTVDGRDDWTLAVLGTLAAQIATIVSMSAGAATAGQAPEQARVAELGRRVLMLAEEFRQ